MSDEMENTETFMPDDLEPLYRLRTQLDMAIQLAESGSMKKLTNEEIEIVRKHPEIVGEIGDFEIRWRGKSSKSDEVKPWRVAVLSALGWIAAKDVDRAVTILRKKLKEK